MLKLFTGLLDTEREADRVGRDLCQQVWGGGEREARGRAAGGCRFWKVESDAIGTWCQLGG